MTEIRRVRGYSFTFCSVHKDVALAVEQDERYEYHLHRSNSQSVIQQVR